MLSKKQTDALRPSLFAGQYNLLLGSGVSLDSSDRHGKPLRSASDLSAALCALKGVKPTTPLSRVSLLLDSAETDKYLTKSYSACRPGETVKRLTSFVWKAAYTLNIDDVLEAAYDRVVRPKQKIESLNYDTAYKTPPTKSHLQIVHLHGFAREPEKGYVFSTTEYSRATRGLNPWMHVLSELLASEPFIIAGTTLNEPDLDYYLSGRTEHSARTNRGPSFFVEPFPDKVTENLCTRHGLILVPATLSDFLAWLVATLGDPPTVTQLIVPSLHDLFKAAPPPEAQLAFFTSFELVRPAAPSPEGEVSPFYFGRAARWSDLEGSLDVPTDDEREYSARARNAISDANTRVKVLCATSDPGAGKTTQVRRVAYDLAKEGHVVFNLSPKAAFSAENAIEVLSTIDRPMILVVDGIADQAAVLRVILTTLKITKPLIILGADRDYRKDHIERVLGDLPTEFVGISDWGTAGYEQLIEHLRRAGILGSSEAVHRPKQFASRLVGDSVAVATCRALNNFRPLEVILRSIWKDATDAARRSYALAALGEHCYAGGIYYPILEAAYQNETLADQLRIECPLPLAYAEDGDYVLPLHPVIADRLLHMLSREKPPLLLDMFCRIANALAPYVNRRAAIDRTPEAKLAARLFSAERVARPLLGPLAEDFYTSARESWQWNSRYWEQRALFAQTSSIDTAIQYARHAVAIEAHPFPWTTLASLLAKKMETISTGATTLYTEIYELLEAVFREESARSWRPTPHPYAALFHATNVFLEKGGTLPPRKKEWLAKQIHTSAQAFPRDTELNAAGTRILERASISK
jgi:hypothetical protein